MASNFGSVLIPFNAYYNLSRAANGKALGGRLKIWRPPKVTAIGGRFKTNGGRLLWPWRPPLAGGAGG